MDLENLGRKVRHYRHMREWSLHDLSLATGLSLNFLESLEAAGLRKIHPFTIGKIADSLCIKIDDLLALTDPPEPPPPIPYTLRFAADRVGDLCSMIIISGLVFGIFLLKEMLR